MDAGNCDLLRRAPSPIGRGWGEGIWPLDRSEPPHPTPLPVGEREQAVLVGPLPAKLKRCSWSELMSRPIIAVTDSVFPSLDPAMRALARVDPEMRMSKSTGADDI